MTTLGSAERTGSKVATVKGGGEPPHSKRVYVIR